MNLADSIAWLSRYADEKRRKAAALSLQGWPLWANLERREALRAVRQMRRLIDLAAGQRGAQ